MSIDTDVTQVGYPTAPATTRRKSTLLDVATVKEGLTWQDGIALFESYNGLKFNGRANFCAPNTKELDQTAGWVDGFRFAAYGGVTCKLTDAEAQEAAVLAVFNEGESTAVERALMEIRFAAQDGSDDELPAIWDAPDDITPGTGAVDPRVAISLLEEEAGDLYVGVPTLHLPLSVTELLLALNALVWKGDLLYTQQGSKVVAGAGYANPNTGPDGSDAADGERWLYATGEVFLGRGKTVARTAFAQESNEIVTLVERPYLAAIDTFAIAIAATLEV